jgi:glycosyltransferase involved in cell wall biosynthesis
MVTVPPVLVSVVIPTFNRAAFVVQAIESVLAQTYPHQEIIVVDDGSTDQTAQVLSAYNGRISCVITPHRGPSAARNAGLRAARGERIAFLDSDDLWLPDKLQQQMIFCRENPTVAICQTEEIWMRNGTRLPQKAKHKKYSGWIFEQCLPLCIVSPSAVLIHRTVFDRVGAFDESMQACEDYDLWLRIAAHYPVYLVDEPLVIKRGGHHDQQSRRVPALDRLRIRSLCKALETGCLSAAQYNAARAELEKKCRIYGAGCRKRGKVEEALYFLCLPERYTLSP